MTAPTHFIIKFDIKDGVVTPPRYAVTGAPIKDEILEAIFDMLQDNHDKLRELLLDIYPPQEELN